MTAAATATAHSLYHGRACVGAAARAPHAVVPWLPVQIGIAHTLINERNGHCTELLMISSSGGGNTLDGHVVISKSRLPVHASKANWPSNFFASRIIRHVFSVIISAAISGSRGSNQRLQLRPLKNITQTKLKDSIICGLVMLRLLCPDRMGKGGGSGSIPSLT